MLTLVLAGVTGARKRSASEPVCTPFAGTSGTAALEGLTMCLSLLGVGFLDADR